jgi:serine/threonine-protein kinase HipA
MARPSRSRALGIWTNGILVGQWIRPPTGPTELRYDERWVSSAEGRPLSLSLPFDLDGRPLKTASVVTFFDNLLPDSDDVRRRIRDRYRAPGGTAFDLLEAIGRDCVGALQLLPEGQTPANVFEISVTPLSESEIEATLAAVSTPARLDEDEDDFRISLAGAQEKTALTWHRGRWCRPHASTPTTHIFKLPLGLVGARQVDMRTSLENEWLCSRLLRELAVPAAECEIERIGKTKALIVTRFDRRLHSSRRYWLRLPQEDFCQATGTPVASKYESDGGPGIVDIARILQGSTTRDQDLATLLRAQLVFWLLAATDGHAKNFSIHLLPQGRYQLTPLYDVLSAWPITGVRHDQVHRKKLRLAMALSGSSNHYRLTAIQRRHFNATARKCGLGRDMEPIILDVLARVPAAIDTVGGALPRGFPQDLFEAIARGLRSASEEMDRMPPG